MGSGFDTHRRRSRAATVVLAFLLSVTACGTNEAAQPPTTPTTTEAAQPAATPPSTLPLAQTPPTTEASIRETPDLTTGTWVATAIDSDEDEQRLGVEAWNTVPGDEDLSDWWFPNPTQFGGPRVFLALEAEGDFIKISLPVQPNGSTGWIRADSVTLSTVTFRAEVDLTNHRLTVWDGDEIVVETSAAIGKPATPTPIGEFFVRDVIPSNSSGAYGSYIVALSGFSEVLTTFAGGLPAIAIHGTNRPDLVGQEVSNGCIRIPNEFVEILAAVVPLGTPVTVVA